MSFSLLNIYAHPLLHITFQFDFSKGFLKNYIKKIKITEEKWLAVKKKLNLNQSSLEMKEPHVITE